MQQAVGYYFREPRLSKKTRPFSIVEKIFPLAIELLSKLGTYFRIETGKHFMPDFSLTNIGTSAFCTLIEPFVLFFRPAK